MNHKLLVVLTVVGLVLSSSAKTPKSPSIESGKLFLQIKQTPTSSPELFQLSYDSSVKSELKLTQSSLIEIEAKVPIPSTQMKFGA